MLARTTAEDDGDARLAATLRPLRHELILRRRPYRRAATGQYAGDMRPSHPSRPPRPSAARARPAAQHPDHDGLDVRRRRRPRVRPLRQPDLDRVRGGARRARGWPLPGLRERAGGGGHDPRPRRPTGRRWSRRGTPTTARSMQLADLELRERVKPQLVDITDTDAVVAACDDASLVWLESPTNPAMEVADIPAITKAAHDGRCLRRRRQHLRHPDPAAAARAGRRPGRALGDEVHRRPRRRGDGRRGHPRRRAVRRAQGPPRPLRRHPRHVRGVARAAGPADAAAADRARAGQRPGARTPPARARRRDRGPLPGLRRDDRAWCLPNGGIADLVQHSTKLWVYATSLGGVESTLERRRRWKSEPATIPDGLIRLSVGIEDVEDLWDDLAPGARLRDRDRAARRDASVALVLGVAGDERVHHVRGRSSRRDDGVDVLGHGGVDTVVVGEVEDRGSTTWRPRRPDGWRRRSPRWSSPDRASRRRCGCARAVRSTSRRGRRARPGPSASAGRLRASSPVVPSRPDRA